MGNPSNKQSRPSLTTPHEESIFAHVMTAGYGLTVIAYAPTTATRAGLCAVIEHQSQAYAFNGNHGQIKQYQENASYEELSKLRQIRP